MFVDTLVKFNLDLAHPSADSANVNFDKFHLEHKFLTKENENEMLNVLVHNTVTNRDLLS
jgi:hypothetical protein